MRKDLTEEEGVIEILKEQVCFQSDYIELLEKRIKHLKEVINRASRVRLPGASEKN